MTVDIPGDGPTKALMAYEWTKHPYLMLYGIWLPGFLYLTGLMSYILPSWIALRLLNVIIGVATVPVFFITVAPVFGQSIGIIATALIAVFPLHVELSASSLTEVSVVFEILIGMAFLRRAVQPDAYNRRVHTTIAICCFVLASMTRYEPWLLLPLFPLYYWLRTRRWAVALSIAVLLFAFPVAWMIGNYVYEGNALRGFDAAINDLSLGNRYPRVSLIKAGEILYTHFSTDLGWVLLIFAMLGLAMELRSLVLHRLSPERILYLFVLVMSLGTMAAFTVFRGEALFNRYLLFSFVFSMPMAVIPVVPYIENISRNKLCCVIVLVLAYTLGSTLWTGRMDTIWVTTLRPQSIIRFTEWLNKSFWRNRPVIFTRMDWQPTYFTYYFPSYDTTSLIISEWLNDDWLKEWTQSVQPSLLVTQRGDEAYVERLFKLTGLAVEPKQPVYRDSDLEVYVLVDTHQNK